MGRRKTKTSEPTAAKRIPLPTNRPTLVFLHGFMGNAQDWHEIIATLERDFECLAPDLPGHGSALVPEAEPFPDMHRTAERVVQYLSEHRIERYSLIGYSMGGRVALYMALRFPQRIDHIVLESASPGLRDAQARDERRKNDDALAHRLETEEFQSFLREWYAQPLFDSLRTDPARFELLIAQRLHNDPAQLARSLRAIGLGAQPSLWDDLPNLAIPTLLLAGAHDHKFLAIAHAIAEQTPSALVQLIPHSSHNIHYEQPNLFAQALRNFLLPS